VRGRQRGHGPGSGAPAGPCRAARRRPRGRRRCGAHLVGAFSVRGARRRRDQRRSGRPGRAAPPGAGALAAQRRRRRGGRSWIGRHASGRPGPWAGPEPARRGGAGCGRPRQRHSCADRRSRGGAAAGKRGRAARPRVGARRGRPAVRGPADGAADRDRGGGRGRRHRGGARAAALRRQHARRAAAGHGRLRRRLCIGRRGGRRRRPRGGLRPPGVHVLR